jgi:putative hydrolase of the HAD superfamily
MYRAILFDLDDTLYDFRVYRTRRLHLALVDVLERYPQLDRDELAHAAIAEGVYIEQLPDFLRQRGVEDAALIDVAQEVYRRGWFDDITMAEDAQQTFELLRPRYKLGLITNGPARTQRPKIERFGLAEYMDVLVVSEEVGVAKPDPAIFLLTLARLGVLPAEALFVGDSPEYDLRGAAAAGIPFVWMNPRQEQLPSEMPPPFAIIARLAELPPLLESIG